MKIRGEEREATEDISTPYGVCRHTKYVGGPTCIHDAYLRGYEEAEEKYTNKNNLESTF